MMMLIAKPTASLVADSGRSAWFVDALVLMVYANFAVKLPAANLGYSLNPRATNGR